MGACKKHAKSLEHTISMHETCQKNAKSWEQHFNWQCPVKAILSEFASASIRN